MMKRFALLVAAALAAACVRAESFSGNVVVRPNWTHTKTNANSTASEYVSTLLSWSFTSGTSTNQMDQLFSERRTLTAGAGHTYDLQGAVTNAFGTVLTMDRIRMLVFSASSNNTDEVRLGGTVGAVASVFGNTNDLLRVRPGGFLLLTAPDATAYVVTATSSYIRVTNSGATSVTYDMYVGGGSN